MWCIVNLPNGTQQAVKWDPKAIGQECLEKVCKALGIICEMEYFGLEHWTPSQTETRTRQWINLRNRLSCDGSSNGIQLMLALRVKFWVPVHFILQESVRNLFYMQAKVDLLEGRLNARDWENAAKLAALLCQADGIRFNELALKAKCPIRLKREQAELQQQQQQQQHQLAQQHQQHQHQQCQCQCQHHQHQHHHHQHQHYHQHQQHQQQQPQQHQRERKEKEHVLSFKKRRLSKQKSVESIDNNVCHHGTSMSCSQAAATALSLAVSSATMTSTSASSSSTSASASASASAAHNSTASTSPSNSSTNSTLDDQQLLLTTSPLRIYQDYIIRPQNTPNDAELPDDFLRHIAIEHGKLATLKMTSKSAKYWLLQEIQDLPGYGEELFSGVTTSENSMRCDIAVGANGLTVTMGDATSSIPFSAIAAAKSFRRTFKLDYVDDHSNRKELEIKLSKHAIAAGLYRSITERHAFYVCDKVRGVVTNQFTRDLKGTIASMFKEDTELGKRYVFDIQHTCREVHDQARRILHERGIDVTANAAVRQNDDDGFEDLVSHLLPKTPLENDAADDEAADVAAGGAAAAAAAAVPAYVESHNSPASPKLHFGAGCSMVGRLDMAIREKKEREAVIERCVDTRISEAMTCKICMDRAINTMFNPCCHVMACAQCAARCTNCPNCRVKITSVVKIYLPPELRTHQTPCTDAAESKEFQNLSKPTGSGGGGRSSNSNSNSGELNGSIGNSNANSNGNSPNENIPASTPGVTNGSAA